MYYVYISESLKDGDYYKGTTVDYVKRLEQHYNGESLFTKSKLLWRLIFVQCFELKIKALIQEKKLKRCNKQYLRWQISQPVNIIR